MANSSIMDSLFQRSLEDLIKGIRLQGSDASLPSATFLSKVMEEIRREIKSTDPYTKSTALLKLTYLHSIYGFDMSWAAFNVVEVISYPQFGLKKIGYMAAAVSFNDYTDVMLLITNQFRKDLSSPNDYEVSLALQCLAVIATPDLSRDLCNDIFTLLSSTRTFVKKKTIAVVLRIFTKYPDSVRVCFRRLVENLEASDPQAMSAAVGVFCELTLGDPKGYLPLAPEFYKVLLDCKNNWVLIKVVKIFAKLAPLEPRLAKKIVDPICEIMRRTNAKSLMLECIRTVVSSFSDYELAVKLAVTKIKELVVDDDKNLKYLGLQALSDLASRHLWAVLENKGIVIKSLGDEDPNVKLSCLKLLMSMVSEENLAEITKVLVNYAFKSDPEFCNEIIGSILATCSRNYYELVFDFDWYVSLLGEMSRIPHCQRGEEIGRQLIDIGMRVKDARPELVHVARDLLIDPALLGNPFLLLILSSAAWVSGEYIDFSKNPFELMESLLQPRTSLLPFSARAIYLQSAFKTLLFCLRSYFFQLESKVSSFSLDEIDNIHENFREDGHFDNESIVNMLNLVETSLAPLSVCRDVEILERARNILGVIELVKQDLLGCLVEKKKESEASKIVDFIYDSFSEELGPVSTTAQARVASPDGLVLVGNLNELDAVCADVQQAGSNTFSLVSNFFMVNEDLPLDDDLCKDDAQPSTEKTSLLAQHRKRHYLYYLPSESNSSEFIEYPPANESKVFDDHDGDVDNLLKLTEQSVLLKKKSGRAKPRPVVVKLNDGEEPWDSLKNVQLKDESLSGAVRELLSSMNTSAGSKLSVKGSGSQSKGKEKLIQDHPVRLRDDSSNADNSEPGKQLSSKSKHRSHGKERKGSNSQSKGKEKLMDDHPVRLREDSANADNSVPGKQQLSKSKHRRHDKERRHRSHGKNDEGREVNDRKDKQMHYSRHKTQRGSKENLVVHESVPDFLL